MVDVPPLEQVVTPFTLEHEELLLQTVWFPVVVQPVCAWVAGSVVVVVVAVGSVLGVVEVAGVVVAGVVVAGVVVAGEVPAVALAVPAVPAWPVAPVSTTFLVWLVSEPQLAKSMDRVDAVTQSKTFMMIALFSRLCSQEETLQPKTALVPKAVGWLNF